MKAATTVCLIALAITILSLTPPSQAQSCVDPMNLCDQWWDGRTSKWIQNPSCTWVNHTYLQSSNTAANPSDGIAVNPYGQRCGTESNGVPCGVRTSTNTCAESDPPIYCDPYVNPDCCADPYDPTCGLGGGDDGGCDGAWGNFCAYSAPGTTQGVEAVLRKAALASPLPKSESALLHALSEARGIYLKARFTFYRDSGKSTASYEYWEREDRYRVRLSPALDFPWSDVAFDGKFLQEQSGADTVEFRRGDDRSTPLPDGPLALALASLRVNDATECRLCQLHLADLKNAVQWRNKARLAAAEPVTGTFDAGALRTGECDAEGRLVRLAWPRDTASGNQGIEVTLSEYQPIAGTDAVFPMRLTARLAPQTSVEYVVEKIDLSPAFGDEVFDIHSKARKVVFGAVDRTGAWHGHYVRYEPTPGETSCTKAKVKP
jgi:hypothetical protein